MLIDDKNINPYDTDKPYNNYNNLYENNRAQYYKKYGNMGNIIEYTGNDRFFMIWDLLANEQYSTINNYSGKWEYNIVPSLMIYDGIEIEDTMIDPLFNASYRKSIEYPNTIEDIQKMYNNIDGSKPIELRKIYARKVIDATIVNNLRTDFLLWLISIKISLHCIQEDEGERQLFIDILQKRRVITEFTLYCDILLLNLISCDPSKDRGNNISNLGNIIDDILKLDNIDNIASYLLILFFRDYDYTKWTEDNIPIVYFDRHLLKQLLPGMEYIDNNSDNMPPELISLGRNIVSRFRFEGKIYSQFMLHPMLIERSHLLRDENCFIFKADNEDFYILMSKNDKFPPFILKVHHTNYGNGEDIEFINKKTNYKLCLNPINISNSVDFNKIYKRFIDLSKSVFLSTSITELVQEYIIDLYEHKIQFIFKDDKIYYKDKELVLHHSDPIISRWIYGLDNCFLLKTKENNYSIIVLKWLDLDKYNEYIKEHILFGDSLWEKQKVPYDTEFPFKDNVYELNLHPLGLSVNGSNDAMQGYLSSIIFYGNQEILDLIIASVNMHDCKLPEFYRVVPARRPRLSEAAKAWPGGGRLTRRWRTGSLEGQWPDRGRRGRASN